MLLALMLLWGFGVDLRLSTENKTQNEPRISCLAVTYNRPEFHPFLLWNFEKQTWANRELVVVDGSNQNYSDTFARPGVRYIHLRSEPSIPFKRNVALDNAAGDIVTWFDDDDWQHREKCALLVGALRDGYDVAGCRDSLFYDLTTAGVREFTAPDVIFNSLGIVRSLALANRFVTERLKASDTDWCRRLFRNARKKRQLSKAVLFFWLSHTKNISNPSRAMSRAPSRHSLQRLRQILGSEYEPFTGHIQEIRSRLRLDLPGEARPIKKGIGRRRSKTGVSVVVAVRDRSGPRVENFLKSLRQQELNGAELEIVIVDSASTADHATSLEALSRRYRATLLRLLRREEWNKPVALNTGIRKAGHEYTLLTDIDMIFEKTFLAKVLSELSRRSGRVAVHCQSRDIRAQDLSGDVDVIAEFPRLLARSTPHTKLGTGACFATRTEWLRRVRGLDERYRLWGAMDRDLTCRAEWDGLETVWLEGTTFLHQWHKKKTALWGKDPAIKRIWDENHRRLFRYSDAATRGHPLPDQVVRNCDDWGTPRFSIVVESGSPTTDASSDAPTIEKAPSHEPAGAPDQLPRVAIAFNVCPSDAFTIGHIIPHVLRQCRYRFSSTLVFSDRTPPAGKYARRCRLHMDEYDAVLGELVRRGVVDRVIEVEDALSRLVPSLGGSFHAKAYNGSPTRSYLASMLLPDADFVLRLDSDMLFYTRADFSWVEAGIRILERDPSHLFCMATPGPYTAETREMTSVRPGVELIDGLLRYRSVTTRYFLFSKSRLLEASPFDYGRAQERMEVTLSNLLEARGLYRVCLHTPDAWHLHTNASAWADTPGRSLSGLIERVERNEIPRGQIGKYDLDWRHWCAGPRASDENGGGPSRG